MRWTEHGFYWWPGHFKVSVKAHQRHDGEGSGVRLVVRTDLLKNVPLENEKCRQLAVGLGAFSPTFSWVFVPPALDEIYAKYETPIERKVWFQTTAYLTPDNLDSQPTLIAYMTILQAISAEFQSASALKLLGGELDISSPAEASKLDYLDPNLSILDSHIRPSGQSPCPIAGSEEFLEIARLYGKSDLCFGIGDANGVTLETPVGDTSALIQVRTDVTHPSLGAGLLGSVQLPMEDTLAAISSFCQEANFLQSCTWSDAPQYASWHPQETGKGTWRPANGVFFPNAFCRPGLATHAALSQLMHARFIKTQFWPELQDKTMLEILQSRLPSQ